MHLADHLPERHIRTRTTAHCACASGKRAQTEQHVSEMSPVQHHDSLTCLDYRSTSPSLRHPVHDLQISALRRAPRCPPCEKQGFSVEAGTGGWHLMPKQCHYASAVCCMLYAVCRCGSGAHTRRLIAFIAPITIFLQSYSCSCAFAPRCPASWPFRESEPVRSRAFTFYRTNNNFICRAIRGGKRNMLDQL